MAKELEHNRFKVGDEVVAIDNYKDYQLHQLASLQVQTVTSVKEAGDGTSRQWIKTDKDPGWASTGWFELASTINGNPTLLKVFTKLREQLHSIEKSYLEEDSYGWYPEGVDPETGRMISVRGDPEDIKALREHIDSTNTSYRSYKGFCSNHLDVITELLEKAPTPEERSEYLESMYKALVRLKEDPGFVLPA